MKLLTAIFCFLLIGLGASAQSFFKRLPPYVANDGIRPHALMLSNTVTPMPDSTFTGFRPVGPAVVYALPGSGVLAGVGVDFENSTWNATTQRWYKNWAIGIYAYGGGNVAPTSPQGVVAIGPAVSFLNGLISVGGAYSITAKDFIGTLGLNIPLN